MTDSLQFDTSRADQEVVAVALAEAREHIDAMYRAALAADQRAMLLGSILVPTAIASLGAAAATLEGGWVGGVLPWGLFLAGFLLLLSAGLALWAARPMSFKMPGNEPLSWEEDISSGRSLASVCSEHLREMQRAIDDNDQFMGRGKRLVDLALYLSFAAACSVLLSVLAEFIVSLCASAVAAA